MRTPWLSPTNCKASSFGATKPTCRTSRRRPATHCGSTSIRKRSSIFENANGPNQSDASRSKFSGGIPNLNLGNTTLFFANPWGIAFTKQSGLGAGYAISAGSDLLVKVNIAGTLS